MTIKVGVLALQGDFAEHISMLTNLGVETLEVRLPKDLESLHGLIIPGGESTTISRLIHQWKLLQPICEHTAKGMGIWGTCAGAILLAERGADLVHKGLQLMDITVKRNAFGRQVNSFVTELNFPAIGEQPFRAVFIRAPAIVEVGPKVKALVFLDDGTIVAAQQDKLLATSFHPELTNDDRFHKYFLELIKQDMP
jgi:5'-phosphate synthase pdxT subunit